MKPQAAFLQMSKFDLNTYLNDPKKLQANHRPDATHAGTSNLYLRILFMTTMTKELTPRQIANRAKKEAKRIEIEKNQKRVKEITINIEWVKSRMWGNCPRCEAKVFFQDGSFERSETFKAGGCGYDKESTVIASAFNKYLKYKLWELIPEQREGGHGSLDVGKAPYGINNYNNHPSFAGGIGSECYYKISEYIGGKFDHVSSGKTFDVYKYTDNSL